MYLPQPLPLFQYQAYGADIAVSRDRFGVHDEMGIGKTATVVGAINRVSQGNRVRGMVVAPAMLRENWMKEFYKFSHYPYRLCKGRNVHDFVSWSRGHFDILITSYELAAKWRKEHAKNCEFLDFIAFDEAHYLKNGDANRTKEMLGHDASGNNCLVEWAAHAWHVTGTLMANDPMDSYTFLRFARAIDMTPNQFMRTFFNSSSTTYGTRNTVKEDMLPVLQQLIQNNSIRRTHNDVGMYLPPIWMKEVLVDGDTREIADMLKDYPGLEQAIFDAIEQGGLSYLTADYVATLRRLLGKAKAVPYAEMLKHELDAGAGKRVVFCVHTEPLQYIKHYGYNFVVADGSTKESERQSAVNQFMNDPDVHGFLGNIKVAGVGLTLTSSSEIDLFESDWSPAGNAQAIKRVHRYGQRSDVHARFITLARSLDEGVNRIVANKTAAIARVEGTAMTASPVNAGFISA
jgi:SWI/SNF-related matrix-associated actin-dependent regulator 1 of chromatin subfamily A